MTTSSVRITLDGRPCVIANRRQYGKLSRWANSYWCPLGPAPGRAWALVLRGDLQQIASAGVFHTLVFESQSRGKRPTTTTFSNLLLVKSQRLAAGCASSEQTVYLAELADRRLLVERFSDTGKLNFNLRAVAHAEDYLSGTAGHTWSSVVATIWNTMSDVLGDFPGLPYAPHGVPENLRLDGSNAWQALHMVLDKLSCTTAYDPHLSSFRIVRLNQESTPASTSKLAKLYDAAPIHHGAAELPETIRVYFHNHFQSEGQQRDTEQESNWATEQAFGFVDVATGAADAQPGTVVGLWDDLPRVLDEDNQHANSADITARANERAANWLAERSAGQPQLIALPGIRSDLKPDHNVKAVLWRAWGPGGGGTATEIVNHVGLPRRIAGGDCLLRGIEWSPRVAAADNFAPPDLARRSYPNTPRLINAVEVWQSPAQAAGAHVAANADGLFPGRVRRWVAGSLAALEPCWIRPIDLPGGPSPDESNLVTLRHGDKLIGRLSGIETSAGVTRPIYLVRAGNAIGQMCLCFEAYDSTGQNYAAAADVPLDAVRLAADWAELASNEVIAKFNGSARLQLTLEAKRDSGSGENITRGWLQHKPDAGTFADVLASEVWLSHIAAGEGNCSASRTVLMDVKNGDRLKLLAQRVAGSDTLTTIADGSNFSICPCPNVEFISLGTDLVACWAPLGTAGANDLDHTDSFLAKDIGITSVGRASALIVGHSFSWDFPGPALGFMTVTDPEENEVVPVDLSRDFDVTFFYQPDTLTTTRHELVSIGPALGNPSLDIRINGTGDSSPSQFQARVLDTASSFHAAIDSTAVAAGTKYHVRVGWHAADQILSIQVDANPLAAVNVGDDIQVQASSVAYLGTSVSFSGGVADGKMDGLRFWQRTIAQYEVTEDFHGGDGRACS